MYKLSKNKISSCANETLRGAGAQPRRSHPRRALVTLPPTAVCQTNLDSDKPPEFMELPPNIISLATSHLRDTSQIFSRFDLPRGPSTSSVTIKSPPF